jgi:hypothetical protein
VELKAPGKKAEAHQRASTTACARWASRVRGVSIEQVEALLA